MSDQYEFQQQISAQSDERVSQQAAAEATHSAVQHQSETLQNPYFLDALRRAGVNSDVFDWVEEEYPEWFADANIVGNRSADFEQFAQLAMMNKRERALAESKPGRLIRDKPYLLAVAQGVDSPDSPEFREPMRSAERRVMYGAAEVATNLMSLSAEGAGVEATSTATTESRVVRQDDKDERSIKGSMSSIFE